jgi:hypothetical protein
VIVAAGAMATPVLLQRSAPLLGNMPSAVGKYFSPNGDRVSMALMDEERIGSVLGLQRETGTPYEAFHVGKPIGSMSYDYLDDRRPEFQRFGLQQIYFPSITNILPEDGYPGEPSWFGVHKKEMSRRWRSWLTLLALTEDDNEGYFGAPPPTGNFVRAASSAVVSTLTYQANEHTRRGWRASDAALARIVEKDGLGQHLSWVGGQPTLSGHPLSSCRIGDDPASSALTPDHELRGSTGLFVTDGSAVPSSLTVNPSLTIAALAERASLAIGRRAGELGVELGPAAPPPERS